MLSTYQVSDSNHSESNDTNQIAPNAMKMPLTYTPSPLLSWISPYPYNTYLSSTHLSLTYFVPPVLWLALLPTC
jgi:hypothetical protein